MSSPFIASFALFIQIAGFRCCCEEWESIPLKWWVNKLRNESAQLLRRIEAAQCLQGCDRLCGGWLVASPNCDAGFSVLRNSKLGGATGRARDHDRISNRTRNRVGVRAHARGTETNGRCRPIRLALPPRRAGRAGSCGGGATAASSRLDFCGHHRRCDVARFVFSRTHYSAEQTERRK